MVHHHAMVENQSARWVKGEHELKIWAQSGVWAISGLACLCRLGAGYGHCTMTHNVAQCTFQWRSCWAQNSHNAWQMFQIPSQTAAEDRMDLIWFNIRLHRKLLHMSACVQYELRSCRLWSFWGGLSFVSVWHVSPPSSLRHVAFYGKGMPALGTQWKAFCEVTITEANIALTHRLYLQSSSGLQTLTSPHGTQEGPLKCCLAKLPKNLLSQEVLKPTMPNQNIRGHLMW